MSNEIKNEINIDIEKYIKDLSPELQEKARACKSVQKLTDLAAENKVPLPDEALEYVAGGKEREMTFPNWYRLKADIADLSRYPWAHKGKVVYVINTGSYYVALEDNDQRVREWRQYGVKLDSTDVLEWC